MILPAYIDPNWFKHSFDYWAQHCQEAQSAEAIETLKEVCIFLALLATSHYPMAPNCRIIIQVSTQTKSSSLLVLISNILCYTFNILIKSHQHKPSHQSCFLCILSI